MSGGGGGKKGGGKFEATDYRLGIHYAVCAGPVDEVQDIIVSDKALGIANVTTNQEISIDKMGLFGGAKKGGGLKGKINFLLGGSSQVLPEFLASKLGRTPDSVTGYRNICSIWFSGETTEGFTWSTNIPAVPPPEVRVRRASVGLSGEPMIGPDSNPSHIIHECLTNTDWGAGYLPANVDENSFLDAAETFRAEGFGLSLIWTGQTSIEAFVNDILQTVSANLIFDLSTAKWSLGLLRDDYEGMVLSEVNPRNAELKSFQRRAWGETINEVIVTWTNPENEEEETVTQQDATGFAIQKTAVSDGSRNYPGIRSQEIAWRVAERDLRQAGTPLAAIEVDLNLSMRGLKPGDVLRFNWDEKDEDGDVFLPPIIVRVLKVKEPKRGKASFSVSLIEDVFSYGSAGTATQGNEFVTPNQEPVNVAFVDLLDSPYFTVAVQRGDAAAQALEYPAGHISVLAKTGLTDTRDISLYSERAIPDQTPEYVSVGSLSDLGRFLTPVAIIPEAETTFALASGYDPDELFVGGFLVLGEGGTQEICVVTSFDGTNVTLRRGCLDTVPRQWPVGTVAWELTRSSFVVDGSDVLAGEVLDYKLLPITSVRALDLSEATVHTITVGDRMHRPLRPANVVVFTPGKNLFDTNSSEIVEDSYMNASGAVSPNSVYFVSPYIEVEPGETYTIQGASQNARFLTAFDASFNPVSAEGSNTNISTFTVPASGVKYYKFTGFDSNRSSYQFEKGASPTSFEPFAPAANFTATVAESETDLIVSWANRNRLTETAQILSWGDATVTPESGQTTEIELLDGGTSLATVSAPEGATTASIAIGGLGLTAGDALTLRMRSSRDGFDSWQKLEIPVTVI